MSLAMRSRLFSSQAKWQYDASSRIAPPPQGLAPWCARRREDFSSDADLPNVSVESEVAETIRNGDAIMGRVWTLVRFARAYAREARPPGWDHREPVVLAVVTDEGPSK